MNLILVKFGTNSNGLWNMKRYGFETVAAAVEAGEADTCDGFVVLASYYDDGKNMDEVKCVYDHNADGVDIITFPHIGVYAKTPATLA